METLILAALNEAYSKLQLQIPQTRLKTIYVNIEDVEPLELQNFIVENNIPNDAYFGGKPNDYDSFDEICICYDISVPTNEDEKLKYCRDRFSNIVWVMFTLYL